MNESQFFFISRLVAICTIQPSCFFLSFFLFYINFPFLISSAHCFYHEKYIVHKKCHLVSASVLEMSAACYIVIETGTCHYLLWLLRYLLFHSCLSLTSESQGLSAVVWKLEYTFILTLHGSWVFQEICLTGELDKSLHESQKPTLTSLSLPTPTPSSSFPTQIIELFWIWLFIWIWIIYI